MTIKITFSDKTVRVAVEINGVIESAITELPQRTWVGLTEDEISVIWKTLCSDDFIVFARAIERAIEAKNG